MFFVYYFLFFNSAEPDNKASNGECGTDECGECGEDLAGESEDSAGMDMIVIIQIKVFGEFIILGREGTDFLTGGWLIEDILSISAS